MNTDARDKMIRHMFVFGVIIPTLITILVFIGFLICWFKFNLKDRLFKSKKCVGKKQPTKVPPHMVANGIHNGVRSFPDDNEEESARDDDDEPDEARDNKLNMGRSQNVVSKNCEQMPSSCVEDGEEKVALYLHSPGSKGGVMGIHNPNLSASPKRQCDVNQENRSSDMEDNEDTLIQHTFHFPVSECSHLNSAAIDSEGSEDGNYGHFVPLSQALKDPKTRQFFEAAGLATKDASSDGQSDIQCPVVAGV